MAKKKYIETPQKMWDLFQAYISHVKASPFKIKDWVGNKGSEIEREKEKPLTIEGFELYCFYQGVIDDLGDYFKNKDDRYSDYAPICSRIRQAIREDQISGGMAGIYNPSITQRLNNLVERTDATTQGDKITNFELTLKI